MFYVRITRCSSDNTAINITYSEGTVNDLLDCIEVMMVLVLIQLPDAMAFNGDGDHLFQGLTEHLQLIFLD